MSSSCFNRVFRFFFCAAYCFVFNPTASADSLVELIESELGVSEVGFCSALVSEENEETTLFAEDERGTPVGKCPSITVEGEACLKNTFGNDHEFWKEAVIRSAKATGEAKYEEEHGTSSCATTNGECKLCTSSSGLKDGECKFSPSQTEGRDDKDDPQAALIKGTAKTWLKKGDKDTMCAKVEVGCPYECKEV